MAKSDFYPTTDGAKLAFLDNLVNQIGGVSATVGLTAADVTAITNARNSLHAAQQDKVGKKTAAAASVTSCATVDKTTEDVIRAQVRRIKTHPAYTEAIGRQLGVEGSGGEGGAMASATVGGGPRPNLEATSILNGEVEITFIKNGFTGVEIETQRGAETTYSFLARDTEAPYVDTRANLAVVGDGPETRRYRARYLQKDTVTADYSDVLVVTVPGRA